MTDHAHKLRRHAGKIGRPAGDTPAVMHAAAAHIEDLERKLREAEARVAELEAERAEREKQEPIAWYCDGEDGREYNGCPQMSNGRTGIPLYAAPPVTAPVRLTDKDFARLYDEAGFDPNEMREAAEHMFDAIQSAVLRANGFDIQPARGGD